MAHPTRLWLLLALILLAIVSWNILDISTTDPEKSSPSSQQLDFYAVEIDTLQMDALGKPKNRLIAKTMRHFEKSNDTELEQPLATLYQEESTPWVISAAQGLVSAGGETILLEKNVSIHRIAGKNSQETTITTESLRLEPDRDYAETDQPIRLNSGKNIINAIGMKAYIKKPMQIELLSTVRGEYEAP